MDVLMWFVALLLSYVVCNIGFRYLFLCQKKLASIILLCRWLVFDAVILYHLLTVITQFYYLLTTKNYFADIYWFGLFATASHATKFVFCRHNHLKVVLCCLLFTQFSNNHQLSNYSNLLLKVIESVIVLGVDPVP